MYDFFKGTLEEVTPAYAVVDCSGIGYILQISLQTYGEISEKKEVKLYAHLYNLPNDLPVLYGFSSKTEREVFRLLIGVSGVGGNTARTILSTFSAQELHRIITARDSRRLKSVKGLGVKTSEKVIIELVDKIGNIEMEADPTHAAADMSLMLEAISALQMLGFNKTASEKVVKSVVAEYPDSTIEEIIKLALKRM